MIIFNQDEDLTSGDILHDEMGQIIKAFFLTFPLKKPEFLIFKDKEEPVHYQVKKTPIVTQDVPGLNAVQTDQKQYHDKYQRFKRGFSYKIYTKQFIKYLDSLSSKDLSISPSEAEDKNSPNILFPILPSDIEKFKKQMSTSQNKDQILEIYKVISPNILNISYNIFKKIKEEKALVDFNKSRIKAMKGFIALFKNKEGEQLKIEIKKIENLENKVNQSEKLTKLFDFISYFIEVLQQTFPIVDAISK